MKKFRNKKPKKKRNKKYQGAAAQSARDKQKLDYRKAENYLTDYNQSIKSFGNQLNTLQYSPILISNFSELQNNLSSFNSFKNLLPKFVDLSPIAISSRNALLSLSELSNINTIKSISSNANPHIYDWYKDLAIKVPTIKSFKDFAEPYKEISELFGKENLSAFNIQSNLAKAIEYSLYAEKSISSFNWAEIGKTIDLSSQNKNLISNSFLDLSNTYSDLLKSYITNPKSFVEVNPLLSKTTPIEYYTSANFIESISIIEEISQKEEKIKKEIQYENEFTLQEYLPIINPVLLNMWKGAIETYKSNNSDKVRQFTVSLRELFTHIMHLLAPDDAVRKWSTEQKLYDEKGKPTRNARLQYICRNISSKPFHKFVDKDIQSTIEFITIFQDGTHSLDSGFTNNQLIAIKSKAETTLKFLLEIEFSTNR